MAGRRLMGGRAVGLAPVLVCVASLTSCGGVPEDVFAASRSDREAPAAVSDARHRRCGDVDLRTGGAVPDSAQACLLDSMDRAEAELAVVSLTDEGDPVVRFFQTTAGQPGFDVYVNATWDPLGSGGWYRLRCVAEPASGDPLQLADCDLA